MGTEEAQRGGWVPLDTDHAGVGVYANLCNIRLTQEECILHFGQRSMEDPSRGVSVVRLFLSLPHAKRLAVALTRTLASHEEKFGEIDADAIAQAPIEIIRELDELVRERLRREEQPTGENS